MRRCSAVARVAAPQGSGARETGNERSQEAVEQPGAVEQARRPRWSRFTKPYMSLSALLRGSVDGGKTR